LFAAIAATDHHALWWLFVVLLSSLAAMIASVRRSAVSCNS